MYSYDCKPTLTDRQVAEFCTRGYLSLEGVVDDETNRRSVEYLNQEENYEPVELLEEDWFVEGVLRNPQAAGAARSLLGSHFALPHTLANHRGLCPDPAPTAWHCDGYSWHTIELRHLMMFYLPQTCTPEMGPTEFVPGSHFLQATSHLVHHYGNIAGTVKATGTAGTVLLVEPTLWHRRSKTKTSGPIRHLLKYHCWRHSQPKRDWVLDADFNPGIHPELFLMGPPLSYRRNIQDCHDAAELYLWLCGRHDEFKPLGGPGWPCPATDTRPQFGVPPFLQTPDA
jgi:hypothetical protein